MFFDNNGDFVNPEGSSEPLATGPYDCVFTITPANANEKIFLSAFAMYVNGGNGELFSGEG